MTSLKQKLENELKDLRTRSEHLKRRVDELKLAQQKKDVARRNYLVKVVLYAQRWDRRGLKKVANLFEGELTNRQKKSAINMILTLTSGFDGQAKHKCIRYLLCIADKASPDVRKFLQNNAINKIVSGR